MAKSKKKAMRIVKVSSWSELQKAVEDAQKRLNPKHNQTLWFRGVSDRSYDLSPSLLRCFKSPDQATPEAIRDLESDLFFEFMAKARSIHGSTLDEWDVLFLMQHYLVPTRLLDWTETLFVALYFAVSEWTPERLKTPRLFVMNPYRWNKTMGHGDDLYWPRYLGYDPKTDYYWSYGELVNDDEIDWDAPVALYPPQRNARLSAQRGYFTIHGNDIRPIEEIAPSQLIAIDLSEKAVSEVMDMLRLAGVDQVLLFPDLEHLSLQMRFDHGV